MDPLTLLSADRALEALTIGQIGLGKVGTPTCTALVRHGVGRLIVVDQQPADDAEAHRDLLTIGPGFTGYKVDAFAEFVRRQRPAQEIVPLPMTFEAARDAGHLRNADFLLSAANVLDTRIGVVQHAAQLGIPVVSGAVSLDGGSAQVVAWHPALRGQVACPACLLPPPGTLLPHDAGLPLATTDMAAALMYAAVMRWLDEGPGALVRANVFQYDASTLAVDALPVRSRPDCVACARIRIATTRCHERSLP